MKRADTFLTGCPCDSGRPYVDCCEPLHRGAPAQSAVALMRSRYCAYVLRLADYLLATWHPLTRPSSLDLVEDAGNGMRWLGLRVMAAREDGDEAVVEFVARYRVGGASAQRLHETSRFERVDGRWLYRDGVVT